jgi:hypothetical protein
MNETKKLAIAALVIGSFLRFLAFRGELWLDEVWNINAVNELISLTQLYTDSNSFDGHTNLFSVLLFILIKQPFFNINNLSPLYLGYLVRLLPFIFSLLTLYLIYKLTDKKDLSKTVYLYLCAISFFSVNYSTEARGYSGLILCVVSAQIANEDIFKNSSKNINLIVLGISTILGTLFHYSFVIFYLGLLFTDIYYYKVELFKSNKKKLFLHIVILSFYLILYLTLLKTPPKANGPITTFTDGYLGALSLAISGFFIKAEAQSVLFINFWAIGFVIFVLCRLTRFLVAKSTPTARYQLIFHLIIILISPLIYIFSGRDIIYPRYFLPSCIVFLSGFSHFILFSYKNRYFLSLSICLLFYLIGNLRGNYVKVGEKIINLSKSQNGKELAVLSDQSFRHGTLLNFYFPNRFKLYDRYLDKDKLIDKKSFSLYLMHKSTFEKDFSSVITVFKVKYKLLERFQSSSLSGWKLGLYQKLD